jgi:hypothetical protein
VSPCECPVLLFPVLNFTSCSCGRQGRCLLFPVAYYVRARGNNRNASPCVVLGTTAGTTGNNGNNRTSDLSRPVMTPNRDRTRQDTTGRWQKPETRPRRPSFGTQAGCARPDVTYTCGVPLRSRARRSSFRAIEGLPR